MYFHTTKTLETLGIISGMFMVLQPIRGRGKNQTTRTKHKLQK